MIILMPCSAVFPPVGRCLGYERETIEEERTLIKMKLCINIRMDRTKAIDTGILSRAIPFLIPLTSTYLEGYNSV